MRDAGQDGTGQESTGCGTGPDEFLVIPRSSGMYTQNFIQLTFSINEVLYDVDTFVQYCIFLIEIYDETDLNLINFIIL